MTKAKKKPVNQEHKEKKTCFVISPIGSEGSDIRQRADTVFDYIITPAFEGRGYDSPVRIDKLDRPGQITDSIIQHLIRADMVVADLSGNNPNVFYELGIRHMLHKPAIHITTDISKIPFDTAAQNTIDYIHTCPNSHRRAIARVRSQIDEFEKNEQELSNPVSRAIGRKELAVSGDSEGQLISNLIEQVEQMEFRLKRIERSKTMRTGASGAVSADLDQLAFLNQAFQKKVTYMDENRNLAVCPVCDAPGLQITESGDFKEAFCPSCGNAFTF